LYKKPINGITADEICLESLSWNWLGVRPSLGGGLRQVPCHRPLGPQRPRYTPRPSHRHVKTYCQHYRDGRQLHRSRLGARGRLQAPPAHWLVFREIHGLFATALQGNVANNSPPASPHYMSGRVTLRWRSTFGAPALLKLSSTQYSC